MLLSELQVNKQDKDSGVLREMQRCQLVSSGHIKTKMVQTLPLVVKNTFILIEKLEGGGFWPPCLIPMVPSEFGSRKPTRD